MKSARTFVIVVALLAAPPAAVAVVKAFYAAGFEAGVINGATLAAQGCR